MPNVKISAHVEEERSRPGSVRRDETKHRDDVTFFVTPPSESDVPEALKPSFTADEENVEDGIQEDSKHDFSHFVGSNILLQKLHPRLRHLAIIQFCLALLTGCLAIVDIENSKITRHLVAVVLNCEDTYERNYLRFCPAIWSPIDVIRDDLINQTAYDELVQHNSYLGRWIAANSKYAAGSWIKGLVIKTVISILTVTNIYCLFAYHRTELFVMKLTRYLPEDSSFLKSPKIKSFSVKVLLLCIHLPPLFDAWLDAEVQLFVMIRILFTGIKVLKECNELRYNRLGSVLSNLVQIRIHGAFLLKTYFLRYPQTSLFVFYLVVVTAFPYFVILAEYREGIEVSFGDAWWLMVVTVTNLGSGEVRPVTVGARLTVGLASLIGIVTTALWVNVISKYLELPQEERRILAIVEHQKARVRERFAAAKCIQKAWKLYHYQKTGGGGMKLIALQKSTKKATWDWKCTRRTVSRVKRSIESHFSTEDTLIVATNLARIMSAANLQTKKSERKLGGSSLHQNPSHLKIRKVSTRHGEEAHRSSTAYLTEDHAHLRTREVTDVRHLAEALHSLKHDMSEMSKQFIQAQVRTSSQVNEIHAILKNIGKNSR